MDSTPVSKSGKPFAEVRNQLALESLQYIPVHVFDRKERSILSNQLLHRMMRKTSDITTMSKSLTSLMKLIAIPSKSMNTLTKLNGVEQEEPLREENTSPSILVSLAHKLDGYKSEIPLAVLRGLKQLTRQILKYILPPLKAIIGNTNISQIPTLDHQGE